MDHQGSFGISCENEALVGTSSSLSSYVGHSKCSSCSYSNDVFGGCVIYDSMRLDSARRSLSIPFKGGIDIPGGGQSSSERSSDSTQSYLSSTSQVNKLTSGASLAGLELGRSSHRRDCECSGSLFDDVNVQRLLVEIPLISYKEVAEVHVGERVGLFASSRRSWSAC